MDINLNSETTGDEHALACPGCGSTNLHHHRVDVYRRNREDDSQGLRAMVYGAGPVLVGNNMYGNPSERRDGVRMHFTCEMCPALSELTIVQHKGTTYLQTTVVGSRAEVEGDD